MRPPRRRKWLYRQGGRSRGADFSRTRNRFGKRSPFALRNPERDRPPPQPAQPSQTINPEQLEQVATLTPREREIIVLIASGLTADEISDRLFISPYTVKTHINNAMAKLDVRTRSQLVRIAIDLD
ncbi:MAG: LuxR C-terminal-related transcriptional regulator [Thermomicrobiales bacterium]